MARSPRHPGRPRVRRPHLPPLSTDADLLRPSAAAIACSCATLRRDGPLTLAYNVVLLTSLAASGLAMHVLARASRGSTAAAFVAGLAWACWPYRTAHLLHLQLQALYFLPLALWALTARGGREALAGRHGSGASRASRQSSRCTYGVMTALALLVAAPVVAWTTGQWRARRYWSRVAVGGPGRRGDDCPGRRAVPEIAGGRGFRPQPRMRPPITPPPAELRASAAGQRPLWAHRVSWRPDRPAPGERDRRHVEHQMFPGVVLMLLPVAGLVERLAIRSAALVVTAAVLVGPGCLAVAGSRRSAWDSIATLATHAFGFDAIRAPARFGVVAMLGPLPAGRSGEAALGRCGRCRDPGDATFVSDDRQR